MEVHVRFYLSCTPSLSSCLISAMTALGSKDLVFSSTQFSGSKSEDVEDKWARQPIGCTCFRSSGFQMGFREDFGKRSSACGGG